MNSSKKVIFSVSLALAYFVVETTITATTGSLTVSLDAAQSTECAAIASSCLSAQTSELILLTKQILY